MSYTKKTWQNLPNTTTPLDATGGMNDLETRINNGIQMADALSIPSDTNNIVTNSDLNDFTTEGAYKCQSAAIAATLNNTPYTAGAFKLIVIKYHDVSNYGQFLLGLATPIIYFRTFSSGGWSTWRAFNNNYSTSEQVVGTWINGKPLYRKVINFGSLPNSTTKSVSTGLTNVVYVNIYGYATDGSYYWSINSPRPVASNPYGIGCYIHNNSVTIECGTDKSTNSAYVIVEYTKTTD